MNTLKEIKNTLNEDRIAIAGVSRDPKKFGNALFSNLMKQRRNVIPINPHAEDIDKVKCFSSVSDLPAGTNSLIIATSKDITEGIISEAATKGIKNIWIQQGSHTEKSENLCKDKFDNIVINKCVFMFAEPVESIHRFHRTIVKFFGKYPK